MSSHFLHRDPRTTGSTILLVVLKYSGTIPGGAGLRQAALLYGLRRTAATDIVCLHTLRQVAQCAGTCPTCAGSLACAYYCDRSAVLLAELLREENYRIVVMSHLLTSPYFGVVRENSTAALVLDEHNAQTHLKEEMLGHPDVRLRNALGVDDDLAMLERMESCAIAEADLVTVCSAADRERLRGRFTADTPMAVVPNGVPVIQGSRPTEPNVPRLAFFLGTMNYFPNTQAASRILAELGPAIRAVAPNLRVALAGRHMPSWFESTDYVDLIRDPVDVAPLFWASILLVPLEMGGGSRLKILEAFAAGCTVVSSVKGIEGIEAAPNVHFLATDDVASTATAVQRILTGPEADLRRRKAAWDLVSTSYSWQAVGAAVADSLRIVAARIGV
jgi:glycosyltransferase involved in cell wall biosynthesis